MTQPIPPDDPSRPDTPSDYPTAPVTPLHPFEWRQPKPHQVNALIDLRDATKVLYEIALQLVPQCAERTLAIRKLEEFSMWANKAIVFDGQRYL